MKNLNYVLQNYKLSAGMFTTEFDQQILQFEINGMRKLNELGIVSNTVKGVRLEIVDNRVNLPSDFVSMVRMGICCGGVFLAFDRNDELCIDNESGCAPCSGEEIESCVNDCIGGNVEGLGTWTFPIYGQPYSYSYTMGSYAIGPGFYHGGYKIDWHSRQIIFDRCVSPQEIVLEYVGDFEFDMGNAMIPDNFIECLTLWIDYERKYFSPDAGMRREANGAKVRWYQCVRDINAMKQALSKHDWVQLLRQYCYQGTKS